MVLPIRHFKRTEKDKKATKIIILFSFCLPLFINFALSIYWLTYIFVKAYIDTHFTIGKPKTSIVRG